MSETSWTLDKVRTQFVDFFVEKEHTFVPSSGVYLPQDNTLLFANAGMNQFKPIFLGTIDPSHEMASLKRAANSQKCIRAGGKHNDLEDVGRDSYHHTMFEMLGSWSFGDYFKKECIQWAWELLTEVYKLDPERLYVTYFAGEEALGLEPDVEARDEWLKYVPEDRILSAGAKDNFWEMGATGPCGPCSEIHYDKVGNGYGKSRVNEDDPLVIEIWNLVFMQFVREEEGGPLKKLPACHIDTGMGLERLVSILQNKQTNYEIDLFENLFTRIQEITKAPAYEGKYGDEDVSGRDTSYRIVADHIRTITLAISDGVLPSNVGRGYVLRRIIRRAVCSAVEKLGVAADSGFFSGLAPYVVELMGDAFPSLKENVDKVVAIIADEENQFGRTLRLGLKRFDRITKDKEPGYLIPGEETAKLFHTYGFPFDLTRQKAQARGFVVDKAAHKQAMADNAGVVAEGAKKMDLLALHGEAVAELNDQSVVKTDDSPKYHPEAMEAELLAIWCGRKKGFYEFLDKSFYTECEQTPEAENPRNLVGLIFDKTPFYAEQGGQIFDTGLIQRGDITFKVESVQTYGGYVVHYGSPQGAIKVNDTFTLTIDAERRAPIMNNHTSTHLCNFSLRKTLGEHINQAGSLVLENRFRFDFSHPKPMSGEELAEMDQRVRDIIKQELQVYDKEVPLEDAKRIYGVRMMFGEAYPDPVRVVSVGVSVDDLLAEPTRTEWADYAIEFCGGTHTPSSKEPRTFTTISEDAIAKGVRRIVCLTGTEAEQAIQAAVEFEDLMNKSLEGKTHGDLSAAVGELLKELDAQKLFPYSEKSRFRDALGEAKKRSTAQMKEQEKEYKTRATSFTKEVISQLNENGAKYFVSKVEIGSNCGVLKTVIKNIQKQHDIPICLISPCQGKVAVVTGTNKDNVKTVPANQWINEVVKPVNGKGGGKPDAAQGVCSDVSDEQVQTMIDCANSFVSEKL